MNPKIAEGIFALIILALVFGSGFLTDRIYFSKYKGEVKGAAEAQVHDKVVKDAKNQGDANVSLDQYHKDVQAVNDYYHAHPVVRVRVVNGSCAVSKASDR